MPATAGFYFVYNNTTGSFTLSVKTSAGTGIMVAQGARAVLYCDATNVVSLLGTAFALNGVISPSQITSNQNDYSPTGLAGATFLRLSTDASRNITSIALGVSGRVLVVHNVGSFAIVLKDDDGATGTAANRLALSADLTLAADQCAILQYDATTSRWRLIGTSASTAAPIMPQLRLTLTTLTPVLTSDVSGAGTIYYTPYQGNQVPIYDGAVFTMQTFAEVSQALSDATKSPAAAAAEAVYDKFAWSDAGTKRCTRGPPWSKAATVTMTIATPAVVTWNSHGLTEGSPIIFTTTGALPTGIVSGTIYYVSRSPAANTFNVSTSVANAAAGTLIATSGSQSGTHTGTNRTLARGTGAGTTELVMVNGILLNANDITNGPAAQRGTYVGTIKTNSGATVDMKFGTAAANGGEAYLGVWNCYNRALVAVFEQETTSSWTYTTATLRASNASVTRRISYVSGLNEDAVSAKVLIYAAIVAGSGAGYFGIALNATNAVPSRSLISNTPFLGGSLPGGQMCHVYEGPMGLGFNYLQEIEKGDGASGVTWAAVTGGLTSHAFIAILRI